VILKLGLILEVSMSNQRLPAALLSAILLVLGCSALESQDSPAPSSSEIVYDHQAPGMTHPKPVYPQAIPDYADRPRRKKIQGNVLLSMIVNADGSTRDIQVKQSLDKDLDKKAVECVKKWKFEPATKDGQPVAMRMAVQVNFHLY
jgi:TonB family protein